jgi:O-antigen/teichoic acid export membrane protein
MILGRWILRAVGFLSTIILARLLAPEDFGLIAVAMLVIGALQVLAETGQRQAIIRLKEPTQEHYDAAWTIGMLIGIAIAALLFAAAPMTARQFGEPRLTLIIWLLALRPLIQGFENIGIVEFQRALNFRRDLQIMLWGKFGGFVVTISLALWLRSYWALIAGTLAQTVLQVLLSYLYSTIRPRLGLAKVAELWSFSFWSLVTNIASYAGERADHAIIAGSLDTTTMGTYSVAAELGAMPTEELVVPPVRALFAVYSRVAHDLATLREHYLTALSFIAVVASSTSTGVALVAEDAVQVVLGSRWIAAAALLPWFAFAAGILGIARSVNAVLLAAGYARANAWRATAFAASLVPLALLGVGQQGAEGAAMARFAATCVFAPVMLYLAMRLLQIPARAMLAVLWRPLAAAAVMAAAVVMAHPHLPASSLLRLPLDAGIGAAVYGFVLYGLWAISGKPAGAERILATTLQARWRALAR